ncbi:MAG: ATP-binding protein [Thermodesulfobacteriota bacterium]|nr:ATP-binding protein [Thermodesulfobacteriota bacterium]
MISRNCEETVQKLLRGFPAVTITGPRQSGKTTLARKIFAGKPYASLEDPDKRLFAQEDPRSFLEQFPDGAVIDEVQRCPDILSYLQTILDSDGRMGLFILTGSQQFGLLSGISQSLAGRTAFMELLPFSLPELAEADLFPQEVNTLLHSGCYPPLYDRDVSPQAWFSSYTTAYIERDVRQILNVQDLESFQRFIRLCAGRTGQLLNFSSLADECGITHNTARAWISVLEASYIIFLLRPHHANYKKRLVKMAKLYFYDAGLASWLIGIRSADQLATHPLRGSLFETLIIGELVKSRFNQGEKPDLFFWRDSNGNEVDIIAEQSGRLMPLEIKSGKTLSADSTRGLSKYMSLAGRNTISPTLIYGGSDSYKKQDIRITSWRESGNILYQQ